MKENTGRQLESFGQRLWKVCAPLIVSLLLQNLTLQSFALFLTTEIKGGDCF